MAKTIKNLRGEGGLLQEEEDNGENLMEGLDGLLDVVGNV